MNPYGVNEMSNNEEKYELSAYDNELIAFVYHWTGLSEEELSKALGYKNGKVHKLTKRGLDRIKKMRDIVKMLWSMFNKNQFNIHCFLRRKTKPQVTVNRNGVVKRKKTLCDSMSPVELLLSKSTGIDDLYAFIYSEMEGTYY